MKDNILAPSIVDRLAHLFGRREADQTRESFARLYDRAHLVVFRYIYGLSGGPVQDAEDLTAETFLRAWRARERFTGDEEAAVGWLLQIARRLVIDNYRRHRVRSDDGADALVELPDRAGTPEELALAHEQAALLGQLLHTLPVEQREMVVLRYLLGWRVMEIARHLGIPGNTVSVTLRRSLAKLRAGWKEK
ncbi:MAG: sigma-70 family RNA polymerase sigma factor [Herpetosiphonaceae bacterium]|nr:sigma-70 family RNA polymerase sigma factor [Herpetosiphonaceae bacterium]